MEIDKIKNLLEQLKEALSSLKNEELQSNLLPHIEEMEKILSGKENQDTNQEDQAIIDQMQRNKNQDYMKRFMAE
jgi:hypothetical protein